MKKDFLVVFSIFYEETREDFMRSRHKCHAVIEWIASRFFKSPQIAIISLSHEFLIFSRMKIDQKFLALSSMEIFFGKDVMKDIYIDGWCLHKFSWCDTQKEHPMLRKKEGKDLWSCHRAFLVHLCTLSTTDEIQKDKKVKKSSSGAWWRKLLSNIIRVNVFCMCICEERKGRKVKRKMWRNFRGKTFQWVSSKVLFCVLRFTKNFLKLLDIFLEIFFKR
jgi:hypothetical protein